MDLYVIIIIILSVIVLLLSVVIFFLLRNKGNNNLNQDSTDLLLKINKLFNESDNKINKDFFELQLKLKDLFEISNKSSNKDINEFKEKIIENINKQLIEINQKVENRLGEGFEKTNKTFESIIERITKIDAAQKNIEKLSTDVISLNDLLTDKKSRGTFGETQLYQLLFSIFGDNKNLYETQKKLSNGNLVDVLFHAPAPIGDIAVDSKFPLENYRRMIDKSISENDRKVAEKEFKLNVKKHIDDIKNKYIIPTETSDQAIMFIPAEAIFAEISANHFDLVEYAQNSRVFIASPTTLIAMLNIINTVIKNSERDKNIKVISDELEKLAEDFKRYNERWKKIKRNMDTVGKSVSEFDTTTKKIETRFNKIYKIDFDEETVEIEDMEE